MRLIDQMRLYDLYLLLSYATLFVLTYIYSDLGKWLLIITIILCLHLTYIHRKNQPLLIMLIFINTYFVYMILYYFFGFHYSTYENLQSLENTNGTLRVVGLFVLCLFYCIKIKDENDKPLRDYLPFNPNILAYTFCVVVMTLILIFAFTSENNILTTSYGEGSANSTLFEYYFIFALIAQCSSKRKIEKIYLLVINVLYTLSMLLLGLRLVSLIDIMMLFIFYGEDKFSSKSVVVISVIGFVGMSALSSLRIGIRDIDLMMLFGIKGKYMYNNQGDVFLTSSVHYGILQNGFMSSFDRIRSLLAFIANIFLPSSKQYKIGILNQYIEGTYHVGGGGFGAMYAYVWLGYFGVVILSLYISHFINNIYKRRSTAFYGIFLIFTFFRWFSYSLPIIFKMGLYLFIIYWIFLFMTRKHASVELE